MTTPPSPPHSALIAAFVERVFQCHHCGVSGPEERETDQVPGPVRYRYLGDTLLLPFCPACGLDREARRRAGTDLARAVETDTLPWVDRSPMSGYRCTRQQCARTWHHLGGPLPYPVLLHPVHGEPDRRRHPCPWCVAEDPAATTVEHDRALRAVADLRRWEDELRDGPSRGPDDGTRP